MNGLINSIGFIVWGPKQYVPNFTAMHLVKSGRPDIPTKKVKSEVETLL